MIGLASLLLAAAPAPDASASEPVQLEDGSFRLVRARGDSDRDYAMAIVKLGREAAGHCRALGLADPKGGAVSVEPIPKGDPRRKKGGNEYSLTYRCEPASAPTATD